MLAVTDCVYRQYGLDLKLNKMHGLWEISADLLKRNCALVMESKGERIVNSRLISRLLFFHDRTWKKGGGVPVLSFTGGSF